jgi:hypothetical protein
MQRAVLAKVKVLQLLRRTVGVVCAADEVQAVQLMEDCWDGDAGLVGEVA